MGLYFGECVQLLYFFLDYRFMTRSLFDLIISYLL